jgi:NhaP-type Na+/H+ and K+/H+ antiporter
MKATKTTIQNITAGLALLAVVAMVFFAGLYADDKLEVRDLIAVNAICFAMIIIHLVVGGSDE